VSPVIRRCGTRDRLRVLDDLMQFLDQEQAVRAD
jgi:hypothetical protein